MDEMIKLREDIGALTASINALTLEWRTYRAGQERDCAAHRERLVEFERRALLLESQGLDREKRLTRIEDRFGQVWTSLAICGTALVGLLLNWVWSLMGRTK
jgi:hypothetical protein